MAAMRVAVAAVIAPTTRITRVRQRRVPFGITAATPETHPFGPPTEPGSPAGPHGYSGRLRLHRIRGLALRASFTRLGCFWEWRGRRVDALTALRRERPRSRALNIASRMGALVPHLLIVLDPRNLDIHSFAPIAWTKGYGSGRDRDAPSQPSGTVGGYGRASRRLRCSILVAVALLADHQAGARARHRGKTRHNRAGYVLGVPQTRPALSSPVRDGKAATLPASLRPVRP
jgi:hypothetical protein